MSALADSGERLSEEERKGLLAWLPKYDDPKNTWERSMASVRAKLERGASVSPSSPPEWERLQTIINKAWDAAHEFDHDPQIALSAVCEWLEYGATTSSSPPETVQITPQYLHDGTVYLSPAPSDRPVPGDRWRIFWRGDGTLKADPVSPGWGGEGGVIAVREEDLALEARARVSELEEDRERMALENANLSQQVTGWRRRAEIAESRVSELEKERDQALEDASDVREFYGHALRRVSELEDAAREVLKAWRDFNDPKIRVGPVYPTMARLRALLPDTEGGSK